MKTENKMRSILVLCLAVTFVVADDSLGDYHQRIGIPLAARIYEAETAAMKSGSRIVGGQVAPPGSHPYLVGVVVHFGSTFSACGSSMLSNTRVITAAHCWWTPWSSSDRFTLVFGSEYIFYGGVRVDTTDVHMHSGWDGQMAFEYDIAIVNHNHVGYTNLIQPIGLPSGIFQSNSFAGYLAQVSGWGLTGPGAGLPANQVHSHVTVQVITNEACRARFSSVVTERILCTSGAGGVGPCSSDSGGPLSIVENNQRILIGVVSFGGICGAGDPAGFVRVTEHLPWIWERL